MAKIYMSMPSIDGKIYQKTLLTLATITKKHELVYKFIENSSLITKARQDAFGDFIRSDCDYLLTVDSDMVLGPPGILDHMIENCPPDSIIGGAYAMKALREDGTSPINAGEINGQPVSKLDGKIYEISHMPTGFMLTSRGAAMKMIAAFEDLAYQDTRGKSWAVYNCVLKKDKNGIMRYWPEDFSYCLRAKKIGIKIYIDTACVLGHLGTTLYHIEHLRVQE